MRLTVTLSLMLMATLPLPGAAQEKSGSEVYEAVCNECHGTGKLDAPVLGDKKRWAKLVREGLNDLVPAAMRGIRKMPAMGGKPELTDMELARGVIFMANAGGGKFAEPTETDVVRWRKKAGAAKKN